MQHRALLAASGKPAGPLVYYFGSRHRHEEYLYGEEIEAYLTSSVLTHAGLAFSRDQKKKIYIQHKMQEDAHDLVQMLQEQSGVFYLCGPTWPVPDVYATLVGAMVASGQTEESAGEYLENLKEEERYVLEVY
jgi:sulfite reductase (NADPH) flavoprotein alpha-component